MFEISWSEILVIGVVALIVVGPKDLPVLLRAVGKYMGIIKRQAAEFRAQFDEAMRESELDQIRKDVESIRTDAESTLREASRSVETHMDDARREFDAVTDTVKLDHGDVHAATGIGQPVAEPVHDALPSSGAAMAAAAAAASMAPPVAPDLVEHHETARHEPAHCEAGHHEAAQHKTAEREPAKTGA